MGRHAGARVTVCLLPLPCGQLWVQEVVVGQGQQVVSLMTTAVIAATTAMLAATTAAGEVTARRSFRPILVSKRSKDAFGTATQSSTSGGSSALMHLSLHPTPQSSR